MPKLNSAAALFRSLYCLNLSISILISISINDSIFIMSLRSQYNIPSSVGISLLNPNFQGFITLLSYISLSFLIITGNCVWNLILPILLIVLIRSPVYIPQLANKEDVARKPQRENILKRKFNLIAQKINQNIIKKV